MKDIDFDELDKAVSSVLSDTSKEGKTADTSPSPDPVTSLGPTPTVTDRAPIPTPVAARQTASPSLPSKRRGQFMDVVHPSSDMTSGNLMPTRQQPVVRPIPSAPTTAFKMPADEDTPVTAAGDLPASTPDSSGLDNSTPAAHDWPDPLDVMSEHEANAQETADTPTPTSLAPTPDSESEGEASEENSSQTPFLDGTKVDKRPLGAFAADEESNETTPGPALDTIQSDTIPPSIPPELDSEVVAVEEQHDSTDPTSGSTEAETNAHNAPPEPMSPVAQSIPQQYAPETSVAEVAPPHSIFDTKEYHQPLLPSDTKPKRSKVGLVILVLVIMLAIGVGLGVLAFNYGLF